MVRQDQDTPEQPLAKQGQAADEHRTIPLRMLDPYAFKFFIISVRGSESQLLPSPFQELLMERSSLLYKCFVYTLQPSSILPRSVGARSLPPQLEHLLNLALLVSSFHCKEIQP